MDFSPDGQNGACCQFQVAPSLAVQPQPFSRGCGRPEARDEPLAPHYHIWLQVLLHSKAVLLLAHHGFFGKTKVEGSRKGERLKKRWIDSIKGATGTGVQELSGGLLRMGHCDYHSFARGWSRFNSTEPALLHLMFGGLEGCCQPPSPF